MSKSAFFKSSIGRKFLVGFSGLALTLFVITHVLGNFLIFIGPEAYNLYSYKLVSNPFIYVAEAGLLLLFLMHLGVASKLSLENWQARDTQYAKGSSGDKATSHVAKGMWLQGGIILIFVVLHILTFKFGTVYSVYYNGIEVRDLFKLMVEVFQNPLYVVGYIFALIILGLHLSHGVASSLRSLGFNHPMYEPKIKIIGWLVALFVSVGFIIQPIYIYFVL